MGDMKREKLYCWHPVKNTAKNMLEAVFGLCLTAAFWYYRIYAASFVVIAVLLLLLFYQLRFVLVSGDSIRQLHWCRIDCEIPLSELVRIDTKADGRECMVCLYGETDVLELPYRRKTLAGILAVLGVSDAVSTRLLEPQGEDFCESSGGYKVLRQAVQLDALFGKTPFIHREVLDETPHIMEKGCEAAAGSEM